MNHVLSYFEFVNFHKTIFVLKFILDTIPPTLAAAIITNLVYFFFKKANVLD